MEKGGVKPDTATSVLQHFKYPLWKNKLIVFMFVFTPSSNKKGDGWICFCVCGGAVFTKNLASPIDFFILAIDSKR
jgi:hypothetical protein